MSDEPSCSNVLDPQLPRCAWLLACSVSRKDASPQSSASARRIPVRILSGNGVHRFRNHCSTSPEYAGALRHPFCAPFGPFPLSSSSSREYLGEVVKAAPGASCPLIEDDHDVVRFDLVILFDSDFFDHPVHGGYHRIFHLHCIERQKNVIFRNLITYFYKNFYNFACHRC